MGLSEQFERIKRYFLAPYPAGNIRMMGGFAMLAGVVGVPVTYQIAAPPPPVIEITGSITPDIDNLSTISVPEAVFNAPGPAIVCDDLGKLLFGARICMPDIVKFVADPTSRRTVMKLADCPAVGPTGACIDKQKILDGLEEKSWWFRYRETMFFGDPKPVALVIDTTGKTDFQKELGDQPGKVVSGRTKVTMKMEAELSGAAFDIEPKGRVPRELLLLNPTLWEWDVTPKREGQWPLRLSLYVILTDSEGKKISEDKPLAEQRTIQIDVHTLDRLGMLIAKIDPIWSFVVAAVAAIAGLLGWFGWPKWRDIFGRKKDEEEKPQKLEVTIRIDTDGTASADANSKPLPKTKRKPATKARKKKKRSGSSS